MCHGRRRTDRIFSAQEVVLAVEWLTALNTYPQGYSEAWFDGRRYGVTRHRHVQGRTETFYAERLGGQDVISCNVYHTHVPLLKPCEMSAEKVIDFLIRSRPITKA